MSEKWEPISPKVLLEAKLSELNRTLIKPEKMRENIPEKFRNLKHAPVCFGIGYMLEEKRREFIDAFEEGRREDAKETLRQFYNAFKTFVEMCSVPYVPKTVPKEVRRRISRPYFVLNRRLITLRDLVEKNDLEGAYLRLIKFRLQRPSEF